MRDNIKTPLAIFSAELDGLSKRENALRTEELASYLDQRSIPYNEVTGCWEGNEEQSFVIHLQEYDHKLQNLLFGVYGQAAVLTTDINGEAWLQDEFLGTPELIGSFVEVQDVTGLQGYTKFGSRYYTVIPFDGDK